MLVVMLSHGHGIKRNKKKTVACSSIEAEYYAFAFYSTKILWILNLFSKLHIKLLFIPTIVCDNIGTIYVCLCKSCLSLKKRYKLIYISSRIMSSKLLLVLILYSPKIG